MRSLVASLACAFACCTLSSAYGEIVITESDQNSVPYPMQVNELNLGLTGAVTGTALAGNEGTSLNPAVLSNGTNGAGNFSDYSTQVVAISNGTNITYNFATPQSINSIYTSSEWRDYGRIDQGLHGFLFD